MRGNRAIRYVKEETLPSGPRDLRHPRRKSRTTFKASSAAAARGYIIDEYNRGACGAMPAVELADIHVAFDRAFRPGDIAAARDLYRRSLPLLVIQAHFRMALHEARAARRGIVDAVGVRAKRRSSMPTIFAEIDVWLADFGLAATAPDAQAAGA